MEEWLRCAVWRCGEHFVLDDNTCDCCPKRLTIYGFEGKLRDVPTSTSRTPNAERALVETPPLSAFSRRIVSSRCGPLRSVSQGHSVQRLDASATFWDDAWADLEEGVWHWVQALFFPRAQ
jgi:hypothetical protein